MNMDQKNALIEQICRDAKILPVITIGSEEQILPLADALAAGGLRVLEITLRSAHGLTAIRRLREERPELCVGAGTVLDKQMMDQVEAAGAQFIVSPGSTDELLKAGVNCSVPLLAGVSNATDIMRGYALGYRRFKLFPAEICGGIAALKALGGPFPDRQGVGDGQTQVVVAVGREDHIGEARTDPGDQEPVQGPDLVRRRIADRVGHVQGRGPDLADGFQHLGQELRLGPDGILGAELDVVEMGPGILNRAHGLGQNLVRRHAQLGGAVDRAGADKDVATPALRSPQGTVAGVDVGLVRARQGAEDRSGIVLGHFTDHGPDTVLVAGRRGGKAGLHDVDAQILQRPAHADLVGWRHRKARGLFAVAHGGVKGHDPVRVATYVGVGHAATSVR